MLHQNIFLYLYNFILLNSFFKNNFYRYCQPAINSKLSVHAFRKSLSAFSNIYLTILISKEYEMKGSEVTEMSW